MVVHYVDLRKRGIAPGELDRFTRAAGSRRPCSIRRTRQFRDAGLAHLTLDEAGIVARLAPTRVS